MRFLQLSVSSFLLEVCFGNKVAVLLSASPISMALTPGPRPCACHRPELYQALIKGKLGEHGMVVHACFPSTGEMRAEISLQD